jgi:formylglycine-generating enzyme required for sulfatase activity
MKWGKIILVIFGAFVVTALGIDAADTLSGKGGTMLSRVIQTESGCGPGMVEVGAVPGITCVDQYEVSAGDTCPIRTPTNMIESHKNAETSGCIAESRADSTPWSFVTRDQAFQMCARSGKRLPTNAEWYALTLGMTDIESSCNVSSERISLSGAYTTCATPYGAYDFVGNLWEWVSDDVIDGSYNGRSMPSSGYVMQVDNGGVALETSDIEQIVYGKDYFWSAKEGAYGMIRGGYYDSDEDAGIYTVHADTPTNAANVGIGFRCVK